MDATPTTKVRIVEGLKESFQLVEESITGLDAVACQQVFKGKWNIAQQLEHLLLSNQLVLKGLHFPKDQLMARFGRLERAPHSYITLKSFYLQTLKEKQVEAPPRFEAELDASYSLGKALTTWRDLAAAFQKVAAQWTAEELDTYTMMHPAIGLLSVREMLFFIIYHNAHHLLQIASIKAQLKQ